MELYAIVEIRNQQELANLIEAFLEDGKANEPKGNFYFKDGKVTITFWSEPSEQLIKALCKCESITELSIWTNATKTRTKSKCNLDAVDEFLNSESEKNSTKTSDAQETDLKEANETSDTSSNTEKILSRKRADYPRLEKLEDCLRAREIISKASSFEEAIKAFSDWLNDPNSSLMLQDYIVAIEKLDNRDWNKLMLRKAMKQSEKCISNSDKIRFGKNVFRKFSDEGFYVETFDLLKMLEKLKGRWSDSKTLPQLNTGGKESFFGLQCIPVRIPELEELLERIAKQNSEVKDKVYEVMSFMRGESDSDETIKDLTDLVTNVMLKTKEANDVKKYFEEIMNTNDRIKLSAFINKFLEKHNSPQKVKAWKFVAQLKEMIA